MNIQALDMEDVVAAVGLRKTTAPLVSREPCERCADLDTEASTGAPYCKASPSSGDFECESYRAVRELEDIACQVAAKFKRIGDHGMRSELAIGTADGFSNALYVQGLGVEFDVDAFMELAGCGRDDR